MLRTLRALALVLLLPAAAMAGQAVPTPLAGATLGAPPDDDAAISRMGTIMRRTDAEFVSEVPLDESRPAGERRAAIGFGDGAGPPSVIRVKIKFEKDGIRLYDELVGRCVSVFGDPDAWEGGAMHAASAGCWEFPDQRGRHVGLAPTHGKEPKAETGAEAKMALRPLFEAQQRCWMRSSTDSEEAETDTAALGPNLDDSMPRSAP